ncbi:MAG TPA: hypothetical protein VF695_11680 [Sphingomonas sp.]|jgi:hypothetical protein
MDKIPIFGDLQVDQDMALERRMWIVQRVGWTIMLLIAIAALLGLLGPGPLTRFTAGDEGGPIWVEYYRFERIEGPTDIKINLGPQAASGKEARVWIDREYMESIELETVVPEPERVEAGPDRLVYVFNISNPAEATAVRFRFQPQSPWENKVRIGIEGSKEVSFRQFFYP